MLLWQYKRLQSFAQPEVVCCFVEVGMDFVTLRDFAEQKGVTYEAIRRQVAKYETELRGHIVVRERTKFLDEYQVLNKLLK